MMRIRSVKAGVWVRCTEATFVMVARDPLNKTASFVNPLKLVTTDEKEVFQRGIENKKRYYFFCSGVASPCALNFTQTQMGCFQAVATPYPKYIPSPSHAQLSRLGTFSQTKFTNVHLFRRISMNADSLFKVTMLTLYTLLCYFDQVSCCVLCNVFHVLQTISIPKNCSHLAIIPGAANPRGAADHPQPLHKHS